MFTLYNLSLRQMKTTSFSRKYSPFVNILFSYIAYFMRILVILVENTFQYLSQILVLYSAYFLTNTCQYLLRILSNICLSWEILFWYIPYFLKIISNIFPFFTFSSALKIEKSNKIPRKTCFYDSAKKTKFECWFCERIETRLISSTGWEI